VLPVLECTAMYALSTVQPGYRDIFPSAQKHNFQEG